jgi:hypothetical protein
VNGRNRPTTEREQFSMCDRFTMKMTAEIVALFRSRSIGRHSLLWGLSFWPANSLGA